MAAKKLFYSMGEVSEMFDVNPSLIRHWESKFDCIRPHKNKKGNRMFSPSDVEKLKQIYHLVKERGMTLEGANKAMKSSGRELSRDTELLERLQRIRAALAEVREELKADGEVIEEPSDGYADERAAWAERDGAAEACAEEYAAGASRESACGDGAAAGTAGSDDGDCAVDIAGNMPQAETRTAGGCADGELLGGRNIPSSGVRAAGEQLSAEGGPEAEETAGIRAAADAADVPDAADAGDGVAATVAEAASDTGIAADPLSESVTEAEDNGRRTSAESAPADSSASAESGTDSTSPKRRPRRRKKGDDDDKELFPFYEQSLF